FTPATSSAKPCGGPVSKCRSPTAAIRTSRSRATSAASLRRLVPHFRIPDRADHRERTRRGDRLLPRVPEPPFVHVDREGETGQERAATDARVAGGVDLLVRPLVQLLADPARDPRPVAGIDVVEEVELGEEEPPVLADAVEQTLPVDLVAPAEDQVHDVGHVRPVPFRDEEPVPDQLLGRGDTDRRRSQAARPRAAVTADVAQVQTRRQSQSPARAGLRLEPPPYPR